MNQLLKNMVSQIVVFTLNSHKFALHLSSVERVVRVVEITPLPKAPDIVMGVVNMQGRIIPVVNIRKRFRLSGQEISLSDQLIISRSSKRLIGIVVDAVSGIIEYSGDKVVKPDDILPGIEYIEGAVRLEHGIILIHDIDKFLSLEEEKGLDNAIMEA